MIAPTTPEGIETMLHARSLFRAATDLTGGAATSDRKLARVAALLGAVAVAIAEADAPADSLNVAISMLQELRPALGSVTEAALDAVAGGAPS